MVHLLAERSCFVAALAMAFALTGACAKDPVYHTGAGGTAAGGSGGGGGGGGHAVRACSDPHPWTEAPVGACLDAPPAAPGTTATVTLAVDAGTPERPRNRLYEKGVH